MSFAKDIINMHNSKLIAFLKTFTLAEFKAFLPFVQSPYFNSNSKVVELYKYVRSASPRFTASRLNREQTFEYLYPNQTFKEIKLQQLMSDLLKLIEMFWVQQDFEQKRLSKDLSLIRNYRQRGLQRYWEKAMTKTKYNLKQETSHLEAEAVHFYQFQFELERHHAIEAAEQRNREPHLQQVSDSLDGYYMVNKLKYYCKALNYQRFQTMPYEWTMVEAVLEEVEKKKWLKNPAIAIYYHGVQTLLQKANADKHFQHLKKMLKQYVKHFAREEMQNMFVLARNFCIQQLNKNNGDYLVEVFDLYKIEIKQELVIENGRFFASTYKNITTIALMLKDFDWLETFLYEYRWAIMPKMFKYTLSQLRFEQQKYEEVIELLQEAEDEEVLFMLATKLLLIQSYVELSLPDTNDFSYEDKLENAMNSFIALLNRKKESLTKHYIYYLNTVKMIREILKETVYSVEKNEEKLESLGAELNSSKLFTEKVWLGSLLKRLM